MSRIERVEGNLYEFKPLASNEAANRAKADILFEQGLDAEKRGDVDAAFALYQQALGYDARSEGAWVNLGSIWCNRRNFVSAEECYRKALEINPQYALAHFDIANVLDERGLAGEACKHYLEAIAINPQYADAHYNLGILYGKSNEARLAMKHYRLFLELGGDDGSVFAGIARREIERLQQKDLTIASAAVEIYEY